MNSSQILQKEIEKHLLCLKKEIANQNILIGQENTIHQLLIATLAQGHSLIESPPGLGKTTAVKKFSQLLNLSFSRIQFTPDLIPADITGTLIYISKDSEFSTHLGPIFANIILADEINRSPAKVQSALLEAMQEKQVTIGEKSHQLPQPFIVFATQNPLSYEGTYPLPEAQLDRFLLKIKIPYPSANTEKEMLSHLLNKKEKNENTQKEFCIMKMQKLVKKIHLSTQILEYITTIIQSTRPENNEKLKPFLAQGCSPRASYHLALSSQANAFLHNRSYVIPEDIKEVAASTLSHRLIMKYEAQIEKITSSSIIEKILKETRVF